MQRIVPFLWFNDNAEEAVEFYTSIFKKSKTGRIARYDENAAAVSGRPAGSAMTVDFKLEGQDFIALNGGPIFRFTPAISFTVCCKNDKEITGLWGKLAEGGKVLMELAKYPFSEKYGWLEDKYGVNWQLVIGERSNKIAPSLMFTANQHAKAEEAIMIYTSIFKNSKVKEMARYEKGEGAPKDEGTLKYSLFTLDGQEFIAMDSALEHGFTFTEAVSFVVNCKDQKEVDYYWEKLSEGGQQVQCGWLKDKYGVSWQIVPTALSKMLLDRNKEKAQRAMKAMLQMVKLDIKELERAYSGK